MSRLKSTAALPSPSSARVGPAERMMIDPAATSEHQKKSFGGISFLVAGVAASSLGGKTLLIYHGTGGMNRKVAVQFAAGVWPGSCWTEPDGRRIIGNKRRQ